jgi:hypothetical protein
MTTRIGTGGPSTGVSTTPSAARVTAASAQPFKAVMSAGASAVLSGAEQAVTRLPGGPILAAALRPTAASVGPGAMTTPSAAGAGTASGVGSLTPEGSAGTAGIGSGTPTTGADGGGVEAALNQSANQNMYFIELQERISAESRNYSAMSNVLKARHDTVKNAIGNIR